MRDLPKTGLAQGVTFQKLVVPWPFPESVFSAVANRFAVPVPDHELVAAPDVIDGGYEEMYEARERNDCNDRKGRDNVQLNPPGHFRHRGNVRVEGEYRTQIGCQHTGEPGGAPAHEESDTQTGNDLHEQDRVYDHVHAVGNHQDQLGAQTALDQHNQTVEGRQAKGEGRSFKNEQAHRHSVPCQHGRRKEEGDQVAEEEHENAPVEWLRPAEELLAFQKLGRERGYLKSAPHVAVNAPHQENAEGKVREDHEHDGIDHAGLGCKQGYENVDQCGRHYEIEEEDCGVISDVVRRSEVAQGVNLSRHAGSETVGKKQTDGQ